jgi:hypothetical protein
MAHYVTTVSSPWNAEDAFNYVSDFRNSQLWDPGVSSSKIIMGAEPGVGTVYGVKAGAAYLKYKTLEHEPPHKAVLEAASKFIRSCDVMSVVETAEGCDVTYDATFQLLGIAKLLNPGVGLFFDRIGDKAAAGLAEVLDGTAR